MIIRCVRRDSISWWKAMMNKMQ